MVNNTFASLVKSFHTWRTKDYYFVWLMIFDEWCTQNVHPAITEEILEAHLVRIQLCRSTMETVEWSKWYQTVPFTAEYINLISLTNCLLCFITFDKDYWQHIYLPMRAIICLEVWWLFWRRIKVHGMGIDRIDIFLASFIRIDEVGRWRQFSKINYDPIAYVTNCTTTNWSKQLDEQSDIFWNFERDYLCTV